MAAGLFLPLQMHREGSQLHELGQEEAWGQAGAPRKGPEGPHPRGTLGFLKPEQPPVTLTEDALAHRPGRLNVMRHVHLGDTGFKPSSQPPVSCGLQEAGGQVQAFVQNGPGAAAKPRGWRGREDPFRRLQIFTSSLTGLPSDDYIVLPKASTRLNSSLSHHSVCLLPGNQTLRFLLFTVLIRAELYPALGRPCALLGSLPPMGRRAVKAYLILTALEGVGVGTCGSPSAHSELPHLLPRSRPAFKPATPSSHPGPQVWHSLMSSQGLIQPRAAQAAQWADS